MKLLSTTVTICLVLLYTNTAKANLSCTSDGQLYEANLDTGISTIYSTSAPKLQGFSVVEDVFSSGPSLSPCSWEGKLKITLPMAIGGVQDRALAFKFTHVRSLSAMGFPSFHIGDSEDNEAQDILSSSTTHSAEVFNNGLTMKVHANREQGRPTISPYRQEQNFIDLNVETTLLVGDKFILAYNGNGEVKSYRNDYLFSLNGDPPQTGLADYEVYLGMNRLIKQQAPPIAGKGLCEVKIYALTCTHSN